MSGAIPPFRSCPEARRSNYKYMGMKTLLLLIVLGLCPQILHAQWYERRCGVSDLDDLTTDQFVCLWNRSKTVARTGGVISLVGTTVLVGGGITMATADPCCSSGQLLIGYFAVLSGIAIDLIGVPVWLTGIQRKSVLKKSEHFNNQALRTLRISPVLLKNNITQTCSCGMAITFRF